jgi:O-antigen/teichoic acid export membrane protein
VSTTIRNLISGTTINSVGLVIVSILNMLLVPIILNNLGIERFGLIVSASTFSIIGFVSMLDFGIPGALTRSVADLTSKGSDHERLELILSCLCVFCIIGMIACGLLFALSPLIVDKLLNVPPAYSEDFLIVFRVLLCTYIFQFPLLIIKSVFQGLGMFKLLQTTSVISEVLRFVATMVALSMALDFDAIIAINAMAPFLIFLILVFQLSKYIKISFLSSLNLLAIFDLKRLSSLIFVGRISAVIFTSIDKILVVGLLGTTAVAVYELFSKIPQLLNRLLGLSVSAIVPIVAVLDRHEDADLISMIYNSGFRIYYLLVSLPIVLLMYLSEEVIFYWLGSVDSTVVNCMRLMLVWCFFVPLAFGSNILIGINKGVVNLTYFRVSQTLFKVLSLTILIKALGLYAVPVSYLVSCLPLIYLLYIFKLILGVNISEQIFFVVKVLVCALIPILVLEVVDFKVVADNVFRPMLTALILYIFQLGLCFKFCIDEKSREWLALKLKGRNFINF